MSVDDQYLTAKLPSLTDGEILHNYNKWGGDGKKMYILQLFSPRGEKLTHDDVLKIMDTTIPTGGGLKLLLIFIKPPNAEMGHFILGAERVDAESHYYWWDSLNLNNSVLENHFGLPATEMFSGMSLFERGFPKTKANAVMAEARWATCGYWCLVWAHMLNNTTAESAEKQIRAKLSTPIVRDGGAFTEKALRDPQLDQGANSWNMLQKLIELNSSMLSYYYSCI